MLSYIRKGLAHNLGFKVLNFNILGVFRKWIFLGGMKILRIFLFRGVGVITKLNYMGSFLGVLGFFLKVNVQIENILFVCCCFFVVFLGGC